MMGSSTLKGGGRTRLASGSMILLAGISLPTFASAQVPEVEAKAQSSSTDIVVTARKREESLLDIPIAVSALTAEALVQRSITRLDDVSNATPNVSFTGGSTDKGDSGTGVIFIRGIGQTDYANSIEPGVGLYLDGVYLGRTVGGNLDLPDIAQVEVLRGPQGTLFGKNTMGGAINVTTRRPSFKNGARATLTVGERGRINGEVDLDLRLSDRWAARAAVAYRSRDGFVTQRNGGPALGRRDDFIGRAKLAYRDGALDALLSFDYSRLRGSNAKVFQTFNPAITGDALNNVRNNVPAALIPDVLDNGMIDGSQPPAPGQPFAPLSVAEGGPLGPNSAVNSLLATNEVGPNRNAYTGAGLSLRVEYDFGDITLRSITAARGYDFDSAQQQDGSAARISFSDDRDEQSQFSQEINVLGAGASFDWLAGAYYFREKATTRATTAVAFPIFFISNNYGTRTTSLAAFAEGNWRFAPNFTLTAGVRYTRDKKDFDVAAPCLPGMLAPFCFNGFFLPPTSSGKTWESVDPRISLQYRPNAATMLYATFSTGFKSGGFNARPSNVAQARAPFEPERVRAFELGAKTALFDRRVTLSVAAFHYDYRSIQFTLSGLDARGITQAVNGNLGNARLNGVEIEGQARIGDHVRLDFGFGYTDARYSYLDPAVLALVTSTGSGLVTRNSRLPKTPETTIMVGAQYTLPLGSFGSLTARADYAHVSKQYSEVQNFELTASPAHDNVNARLTLESASTAWQVAIYAKNLTNERYIVNGFWPGGGTSASVLFVPNEPREIGASLTARF